MRDEHWKLRNNPEVTVRTRGVMEKCSYCVQRLSRTRIEVEAMLLDKQDLIDKASDPAEATRLTEEKNAKEFEMINGLQTACQQGCPTQAIVFGSINQVAGKDTEVRRLKDEKNPLNYSLLRELTTKPRTTYQVRVRNTNPALA
jgi:molybdopterin-containing oxidoreductase family iron-sulfur binding subunit